MSIVLVQRRPTRYQNEHKCGTAARKATISCNADEVFEKNGIQCSVPRTLQHCTIREGLPGRSDRKANVLSTLSHYLRVTALYNFFETSMTLLSNFVFCSIGRVNPIKPDQAILRMIKNVTQDCGKSLLAIIIQFSSTYLELFCLFSILQVKMLRNLIK